MIALRTPGRGPNTAAAARNYPILEAQAPTVSNALTDLNPAPPPSPFYSRPPIPLPHPLPPFCGAFREARYVGPTTFVCARKGPTVVSELVAN